MVIAGPGTGKTEILSWRIAYILKNRDTVPPNILCLTYTEAAAGEMRKRLIKLIGPEAYGIQVNTFHGFCNLVILENPAHFQQTRDLEPITDLDKFRLLQRLIDQFDSNHPLKKFKGQVYTSWDRLLDLFSTMKKENWKPEYVYNLIDDYVDRMRQDEGFQYKRTIKGKWQKGDLMPKFQTDVVDRMNTLKAAVGEFDKYNQLLAEDGKYDFEDMLYWVYQAFSKDPDLLANYQEKYLYTLVDEFQDTNGIQLSILYKLLDHEFLENPNIFVVGDDDQSIYRFQGASIKNLKEFKDKYDPEIILLEENYRSSQIILEASRKLMAPVEDSLVRQLFSTNKNLAAAGVHKDHPQLVHIHAYPTDTFENADIFHQLKRYHEEKPGGSVAVLYSKHNLGEDLAIALKGAGIPFQTARDVNALEQPMIQHILDILLCLQYLTVGPDNDDALLYRLLHLKYLDPHPVDLQRLIIAYREKEKDDRSTLFMWLGDPGKLDQIPFQNRAWIDSCFQLFNEGSKNFHTNTVLFLVEWIAHHFGILKWILHQPEKFPHLYALKSFYSFVEKESIGKAGYSPGDLLETCNLMRTYKIRLPVQELMMEPTGIFLSSVHGAKGLQFDTVFIKNLVDKEWENKKSINRQFTLPDNLIRSADQVSHLESGQNIQEYDRRRLLYVGMTRPHKELYLSYGLKADEKRTNIPSKFLVELNDSKEYISWNEIPGQADLLADYMVNRMSGFQTANLHLDETEIDQRVKNYVLNITAVNVYLECPLRFYYEKILRIPTTKKPYLIFGSAMHEGLQKFFNRRYVSAEKETGVDYLVWAFEQYMYRYRYQLTEKQYSDQLEYGAKILRQFYETYGSTWSEEFKYDTEYQPLNMQIEGIPVTGLMDRVDKLGDQVWVYDYKTGSTTDFAKKLRPPSPENPIGGSYWRQMVFYDLLLERDPKFKTHMTQGYLQALEPGKDGRFVRRDVTISDEDRQAVTQILVDTYQKIQNKEFHKGCGECDWCRMHDLNPPITIEDEEESL